MSSKKWKTKKGNARKQGDDLDGVVCQLFGKRCRLQNEIILILAIIGMLVLVVVLRQSSFFGKASKGVSFWRATDLLGKKSSAIINAVQTESGENNHQGNNGKKAIAAVSIDTKNWESYANDWYGFELRYPGGWEKPVAKKPLRGNKWEQSYIFQKRIQDVKEENGTLEDKKKSASPENIEDEFVGFAVNIYSVASVKELRHTNEFPVRKDVPEADIMKCEEISGHLTENANFPAEEIHIPPGDDCYHPAFFFSLTRERYIYNIVPLLRGEDGRLDQPAQKATEGIAAAEDADPKLNAHENFPEFLATIKSFALTEIKRPPAKPPAPKITAPFPVSYKRVGGKLVCAKKNDKPRKSKQGKGKHLDMEYCLDPDEYPNPHCTY